MFAHPTRAGRISDIRAAGAVATAGARRTPEPAGAASCEVYPLNSNSGLSWQLAARRCHASHYNRDDVGAANMGLYPHRKLCMNSRQALRQNISNLDDALVNVTTPGAFHRGRTGAAFSARRVEGRQQEEGKAGSVCATALAATVARKRRTTAPLDVLTRITRRPHDRLWCSIRCAADKRAVRGSKTAARRCSARHRMITLATSIFTVTQ